MLNNIVFMLALSFVVKVEPEKDLYDQFGEGKSFCKVSIFLHLSEDERNIF